MNTTNSSFDATGGLTHYIHQLAGKELNVECKKIGKLKVGQACLTSGYELCKYIIHTASQYGIDKDHAVNYESDSFGTRLNYEVLDEAIQCICSGVPLSKSWKSKIEKCK